MRTLRCLCMLMFWVGLTFFSQGCACFGLVSSATKFGHYTKQFELHSAWINEPGDIIMQGELVKHVTLPQYKKNLGIRYLLASYQTIIKNSHPNPYYDRDRKNPYGKRQVICVNHITNKYSPSNDLFCIWPNSLSWYKEVKHPPLMLSQGKWTEVIKTIPVCEFQPNAMLIDHPLYGNGFFIQPRVYIEDGVEWWSMPVHVLLVPAFLSALVIDIVTFPIQAGIVLHGLSGIH